SQGGSMALTDTALKALKPKEKPYVVRDDCGLYVEVFDRLAFPLSPHWPVTEAHARQVPALTLKNARLKRDEAAAHLVALGESPAQKKQREKIAGSEDATVAVFAERFFSDIQERDRKDNTMPRRYLDKDIIRNVGQKPIKEVTAENVRSAIWKKRRYRAWLW